MKIRNINMKEGKVYICVPITSSTHKNIIEDAKSIAKTKAEMVEWRVDHYEDIKEIDKVIQTLKEVRIILKEKVLLFTCRSTAEGGTSEIEVSEYLLLLKTAILSKMVDIIDVELLLGDTIINAIVKHARMCDVKVLMSNHDMNSTPRYDVIENRINIMYEKGADIAKVAYTPKNEEDVNVIIQVAKDVSKEKPYVLISMGELGKITRIEAKKIGSCMTFAALDGKTSAPGQVSIESLYQKLYE